MMMTMNSRSSLNLITGKFVISYSSHIQGVQTTEYMDTHTGRSNMGSFIKYLIHHNYEYNIAYEEDNN